MVIEQHFVHRMDSEFKQDVCQRFRTRKTEQTINLLHFGDVVFPSAKMRQVMDRYILTGEKLLITTAAWSVKMSDLVYTSTTLIT